MGAARKVKEISAVMPAGMGLAANVAAKLNEAGVNIEAIHAWERSGEATFQMVTDNADAAVAALEELGAAVTARHAVAIDMPDEPGALERFASTISERRINIFHLYGSSSPGAGMATVIFDTSEDDRVVDLF